MKKTICILLMAVLLLSAAPIMAAATDTPYRIALPASPSAAVQKAAETLQRYLTAILGTQPEMTTAAEDAQFSVGELPGEKPAGSYRIARTNGGMVRIAGSGENGAQNGVYAFLREYCGCRWYAGEAIVVPTAAALDLPDEIDRAHTPYFEYTYTDWFCSNDAEFVRASGQTGNGCYTYGFCHTLSTRFCSRDKYFASHPEYFALHDGERSPNQLCLTNPDTLRVVTDEVLAVLQSRHDPDADLQIISLTQDDNGDYCECPACQALDDANGSHAGTNVTFANAVADAVKAAGYDNVAIDTFAYQYTRKPPTQVVPRDNVIIRLCSIECCFCHTLDDARCRENCEFMQDLTDWGKICRRIYIWDYTNNYWEYHCIYPDFGVLQRNVQLFYENGAKGLFEEGAGNQTEMDAEFGALRGYLLTRLMQDPYLDFDAEMRDFLQGFYGDGGDALYRFLLRTIEKAGASYVRHLGTFPDSTETLTRFTAADVFFADDCWREAKEKTAGTLFADRVERSELCWRYWKCSNLRGEFSPLRSTLYTRMRGREALYNDLKRFNIRRINDTRRERGITECMSLVLLRRPGKWCALYEEPFWDAIEPAVLRVYKALEKLHDTLFPAA